MLTFTPPAGFEDVSEYTFGTATRRVVVRHSHAIGSAADQDAGEINQMFDLLEQSADKTDLLLQLRGAVDDVLEALLAPL